MATQTTTYTVSMGCEGGGSEEATIEATDLRDAKKQASAATAEWIRDGEWGDDGARVSGTWTLTDADGDEIAQGGVTVEIDPDHAALIEAACDREQWERCCGGDPDDHDWTSEGEGGCDENPGVWSTGGTSMSFASHCRACGLRRSEHHIGSQRNPGEHDTASYEMPETWCAECQSEECSCPKLEALSLSDLECVGTCPADQGQIVERTWYSHERGPVLRTLDRSDMEETWTLYEWSDDEGDALDPQNGDTSAAKGAGVEVEVS